MLFSGVMALDVWMVHLTTPHDSSNSPLSGNINAQP